MRSQSLNLLVLALGALGCAPFDIRELDAAQGVDAGDSGPGLDDAATDAGAIGVDAGDASVDGAIVIDAGTDAGRDAGGPRAPCWRPMSTTGAPRPMGNAYAPAGVWTGSRFVLWSGYSYDLPGEVGEGGAYEPRSDTWTPASVTGAPTARRDHVQVWTGTELLVWGGFTASGPTATGARWDLARGVWRPMSVAGAPSARRGASAVWTGRRLIVWGGSDAAGTPTDTGALYDPSTDTWAPMSAAGAPGARWIANTVWTGREMLVFGGAIVGGAASDGGLYDPEGDSWRALPAAAAPSGRYGTASGWTGGDFLIWGGYAADHLGDGGIWNESSGTWSMMTSVGAPSARSSGLGLWTNDRFYVWGGGARGTVFGDGAAYDPLLDRWEPMETSGGPIGRTSAAVAWTGEAIIVWSGHDGGSADRPDGALYFPSCPTVWPATVERASVTVTASRVARIECDSVGDLPWTDVRQASGANLATRCNGGSAATSGLYVDDGTRTITARAGLDGFGRPMFIISRLAMLFPAAPIPAGARVVRARLRFVPQDLVGTGTLVAHVVAFSPDSSSAVSAMDYSLDHWGAASLGSIRQSDLTAGAASTIELDAERIDAIVRGGGAFALGMRGHHDLDDTVPPMGDEGFEMTPRCPVTTPGCASETAELLLDWEM